MTTTTMTAVPAAEVRPIAWRRLAWVAWRRQRTMVVSTLGLLGVLAVYLLVTGLQLRSAWQVVRTCAPQNSSSCQFAWRTFMDTHSNPGIISALFIFAPLLIGVFAGAPLIGRELESGTFRYAWTQGVGRVRWAVALIVPGAVMVAVLAGAAGALISWHDRPLWQADIVHRLAPSEFPATGIAIVGWALLAYAAGVLAGLLWRRVLPALATSLGLAFGCALAASRFRLDFLAPLSTSSLDFVPGTETVRQWWEKGGVVVGSSDLNAALRAAGLQQIDMGGGGKTTVMASPGSQDPISYLLGHGFTQWTSYQPAGRYWTFQWIEFGWLTALAALLLGAALWLVRRTDG